MRFGRTSEKQDTKKTEASAEIAWRDAIGASSSMTTNKANSDVLSGASALVSQSGCNFSIGPSTPGDGRPLSVTLNDVVEMARSIQTTPPDGRKEIALLRHYR
jgi:hypothetical protein